MVIFKFTEPGDILDISELNEPVLTEIEIPDVDIKDPGLQPVIKLPVITPIEELQRKKRAFIEGTFTCIM